MTHRRKIRAMECVTGGGEGGQHNITQSYITLPKNLYDKETQDNRTTQPNIIP